MVVILHLPPPGGAGGYGAGPAGIWKRRSKILSYFHVY